jgi:hypothetical protein
MIKNHPYTNSSKVFVIDIQFSIKFIAKWIIKNLKNINVKYDFTF